MGELDIARAIYDAISERVGDINVSFPVIIEEYLGPVHKPGGGMELGVLQARARVRPKYTKLDLNGKEVVLPPILCVPVSWWLVGDFLFSFPFKKGQIAKVTCSQRALDYILRTHDPEHPRIVEFHREDDAILEPFGIRVESDPLRPNEALDCFYIACVKNQPNDLTPIAKFIMKPDGEIKFVCPKFTVISPDVEIGDYNRLEAIRINVDADNDSETNGPDIHPSGSKCTFIATQSSYREGLTEKPWTKGLARGTDPDALPGGADQGEAQAPLGGILDNLGKTVNDALQALGLSVEDALQALGLPSDLTGILDKNGLPSVNEIKDMTLGAFNNVLGTGLGGIVKAFRQGSLSELKEKVGASSFNALLNNTTVQQALHATGVDAEVMLKNLGISPESELRKQSIGDLAQAIGKGVSDILAMLGGE
jgi:hypothetical protein